MQCSGGGGHHMQQMNWRSFTSNARHKLFMLQQQQFQVESAIDFKQKAHFGCLFELLAHLIARAVMIT